MTHKKALTRITRDDTEHGKEYYLASDVDALLAQTEQEPFGYFKPEPFGWTDCAETDEGAIALYDRPQRKE